jgi:DNA-binding transcriptional LysR family regulator
MPFGDVTRLRAFALVLDLGSVSAAAAVLGYTQSAVSQQIAALEREVGATLIDRSRRPFRATREGEALRPDIDRVLTALTAAEATVKDVRAGAPQRLRLASFPSALASFVPHAMRELRRSHPHRDVEVLQADTNLAFELLAAGAADVAIVQHVSRIPALPAAYLERHVLLQDELHVVLPRAHRLASRDEVRLAEIEHEPLLVPRRDGTGSAFRSLVEHLCAQHGFKPRIAYEVDDLAAAQAFAASGVAVVLMHGLTVHSPLPGVVVRRLSESPHGARTVEAVLPAGDRSAAAEALLRHLATAASLIRR